MPNLNHTPGPWQTEAAERVPACCDGYIFARTPARGNPQWIARVYRRDSDAQRDADARLIAAAPALLAALVQASLRLDMTDNYGTDELRRTVGAAIKLARGE